jgi:hypothetical protein
MERRPASYLQQPDRDLQDCNETGVEVVFQISLA